MDTEKRRYRSTESKYKGRATEMYITYDRKQTTRSGREVVYPKVKRVYIAGDVKGWKTGEFKNKSGREVHGVLVEYEQTRDGYRRKPFTAKRGNTTYKVSESTIKPSVQKFSKVIEIPDHAQNVKFHQDASKLPEKYQDALQDVR